MTPKEKAFILVSQFHNVQPLEDDCNITMYEAQQCALITVDEILLGYMGNPKVKYWQEVKQEIEKL
jgi:hypothetical protein